MHESEKWKWSCSVVSDSSRPHGLQPTRLFRPWDFPGKRTGVGCHCLLRWYCYRSLINNHLLQIKWNPRFHHQLSEPTQTHVHHDAICHPLLLLHSILPNIRVFSNESALRIRWPKYWNFSFSIRPSNGHPGLISFRMDWLDLLVVQGTLKSLLQHHSSKAGILQRSAFFIVQLSHPYMTTGKTIALTRRTFVDKVMSLLFNMLSRLVITFLPRSKCLLISWRHYCCYYPGSPRY